MGFIGLYCSFLFITALLTGLNVNYMANTDQYPSGIGSMRGLTPMRSLCSVLIPVYMVVRAKKRRSLSLSGRIAAFIMGMIMTLASTTHIILLLTFFVVCSKITKFRSDLKSKISKHHREGEGNRDWTQVIANGGHPLLLSMASIMEFGFGVERFISFDPEHYFGSCIDLGLLGAVACCTGDTFASEIGSVIGSGRPYLITTWKRVPRGTNGGVSIGGSVASILGGCLIGFVHVLCILLLSPQSFASFDSAQILLIPLAGAYALLGSTIDSLLGAWFQYSGVYKRRNLRGVIVDEPGSHVTHISGWNLLSNDSVNLLSAILTAIFAPSLAFRIWHPVKLFNS